MYWGIHVLHIKSLIIFNITLVPLPLTPFAVCLVDRLFWKTDTDRYYVLGRVRCHFIKIPDRNIMYELNKTSER